KARHQLTAFLFQYVDEDDFGALARKGFHQRRADAGSATGDRHPLPGKAGIDGGLNRARGHIIHQRSQLLVALPITAIRSCQALRRGARPAAAGGCGGAEESRLTRVNLSILCTTWGGVPPRRPRICSTSSRTASRAISAMGWR